MLLESIFPENALRFGPGTPWTAKRPNSVRYVQRFPRRLRRDGFAHVFPAFRPLCRCSIVTTTLAGLESVKRNVVPFLKVAGVADAADSTGPVGSQASPTPSWSKSAWPGFGV